MHAHTNTYTHMHTQLDALTHTQTYMHAHTHTLGEQAIRKSFFFQYEYKNELWEDRKNPEY